MAGISRNQGGSGFVDGARQMAAVRPHLRGQDMRGSGALVALGVDQPPFAEQGQHGLEQQEFGFPVKQALAELAQDRGITARVGQLQRERVFPINARPDPIRRLRVREPFGKLPHRNERELCRGFRRPLGIRKEPGAMP